MNAPCFADFHPALQQWFSDSIGQPTEVQQKGWRAISAREHTLIAAPTGSGKTLAAFLAAINELVLSAIEGSLQDQTTVLYISPLKALSNDIEKNLQEPLLGIAEYVGARTLCLPEIRSAVRTGDTPASQRSAMLRRPPHILVTTPESLYILLTSAGGRKLLRHVKSVIIDEIHALIGDRRGAHLALSIERLQALCDHPLQRIALSATQKPIEEVARFLVGMNHLDVQGNAQCEIIDVGLRKHFDIAIEVPKSPLEAVISLEQWQEVHQRLGELINEHHTTLVFVNTRRLAERLTRDLAEIIGAEHVGSHHGSLSKDHRLRMEQRLKAGDLRCLVATASLELGIDIGSVDLVCQIGSTRTIAGFLQRIGRSRHQVGGTPKGRIFPTTRDELVECVALFDAVKRSELDTIIMPERPLDILAQQIVAAVSMEEWSEDELFQSFSKAYSYRNLATKEFEQVLKSLSEGYTTHRGRKGAHIFRDQINNRLRGRKGAHLAAVQNGGAIPELADYQVILEPGNLRIGSINEDFAIESMAGDIFQLGNHSWKIIRVETGKVRVSDAKNQPPSIPFWLGEAPSRSPELSFAVSRLRSSIDQSLLEFDNDPSRLSQLLQQNFDLPNEVSSQLAEYLATTRLALGCIPTQNTLVLERFFDESGGMQLVIHSPFGSRINRAWGLALRKRFCRSFNFELQAAATEDAIVMSLGPTHSFPLEDVYHFLHTNSVRTVLVQALLDAPMFSTRWRWNMTRSLAVLRQRGGTHVAPQLQRMQADDLLATIFPAQVACLENIVGDREIPDDPLVRQTIDDCLHEAMDIDGLEKVLQLIEERELNLVVRDLVEPSPLAHEILNARPYAFLDDAPLEERRTRAVVSRRHLQPDEASQLGTLDPHAIAKIQEYAWPTIRNPDELHEALMLLGCLNSKEILGLEAGEEWQHELIQENRACLVSLGLSSELNYLLFASERFALAHALYPEHESVLEKAKLLHQFASPYSDQSAAINDLVRCRMEACGPTTAKELAARLSRSTEEIDAALLALESMGIVFRGQFHPDKEHLQWCERSLLARIHRATIGKLRADVDPVSRQDFMRFLVQWHGLAPTAQMAAEGPGDVADVLQQLEGFEAAAGGWEPLLLTPRLPGYQPTWLDTLCMSGQFTWLRLRSPRVASQGGDSGRDPKLSQAGPIRSTPISLLPREQLAAWQYDQILPDQSDITECLSSDARQIYACLNRSGACFVRDLQLHSGLLVSRVETALAELAARGLVVSDSFAGLRALIQPSDRRAKSWSHGRSRRGLASTIEQAGRWSIVTKAPESFELSPDERKDPFGYDPNVEYRARVYLRRYGVVFRSILERERHAPPWRDLLRIFRSLEDRGEIRGGQFVAGISGEQFALPEAKNSLQRQRKQTRSDEETMVVISAVDPLNLLGILLPGPKLSATLNNRLLLRNGKAIASLESGEFQALSDLSEAESWQAKKRLEGQLHTPQSSKLLVTPV